MFDADLSATPVSVTVGECIWLSVVNNTAGGNCTWLWQTAPLGDGFPLSGGSVQTGAPPVPAVYGPGDAKDYDMSWCVDIQVSVIGCLGSSGTAPA